MQGALHRSAYRKDASTSPVFGQTFSALADRNFRLFYIGVGVSFTGAWMRRTALGWVVFDMTRSYQETGVVFAAALLPLCLFAPFAGSLADRMDKRHLIIYARILAFLVSAMLAALLWLGSPPLWAIYVLAAMTGVAFAFEVPTRHSFVVELVGKDKLMNAIALNSALINVTRFIGPALAGFLMGKFNPAWVFAADALSSLVVITMILMLRLEKRIIHRPRGNPLTQLIAGAREAVVNKPVRNMLLMLIFVVLFGWSFDTLIPGIANEILRVSEFQFGVLQGVFGVGAVIGALYVAGRGSNSRPRLQAYGGAALFFVMLIIMTMLKTYATMIPCLIIAGFGAITFLSTANTIIQTNVDDSIRGRVMGMWTFTFGACMPLGSLLQGWTAEQISPWLTIEIFAITGLLGAAALFTKNRAWELFLHKSTPENARLRDEEEKALSSAP